MAAIAELLSARILCAMRSGKEHSIVELAASIQQPTEQTKRILDGMTARGQLASRQVNKRTLWRIPNV